MNWNKLKPYIWILAITGILLMFVPWLFIQPWTNVDFTDTGNIGETIGGTTAPFIGFLGVVVTFMAFWIQYEANEKQRNDISQERFESQFYEMLRLHRANVDEMEILSGKRGVIKSRKLLMRMFYEFKFIFYACKKTYQDSQLKNLDDENLLTFSYLLFFHGIDEVDQSKFSVVERELFEDVYRYLDEVRDNYKSHKNNENSVGDVEEEIELENGLKYSCKFLYYPFDGHTNRLPHYYRHLFQMISFIVDESELDLSFDQKYRFIKMIRAQLSNYEQLLLFYNSFVYGKPWIERKYFDYYRIIKNLPLGLADFGVKPRDIFPEIKNELGEFIFESDEYAANH